MYKYELCEQSSLPTLIMMKAYVCNLIAEGKAQNVLKSSQQEQLERYICLTRTLSFADKYLVVAVQAVGSVVDELSSIDEESKYFRSDVLQFL